MGGAIPKLAAPAGFTTLQAGLYAPSPNLQVSPRRRKGASATLAIPLTGQATVFNTFPVDAADILQPGDAYLIDYAQMAVFGAALGLLLQTIQFGFLNNGENLTATIGQNTATNSVLGNSIGSGLPIQPEILPSLWSSYDLNFLLNSQLGPLSQTLSTLQPLRFFTNTTISNPTAGAINATVVLVVFYRIVKGLQEA